MLQLKSSKYSWQKAIRDFEDVDGRIEPQGPDQMLRMTSNVKMFFINEDGKVVKSLKFSTVYVFFECF